MSMGNTIGSGRYHTFTYQDGTRRLATAALDRQELSGTDETTTYTYNAAGNPTTIQAAIGSTSTDTQCFSYGAQAQLTEVWTPASNDCATAKSQTGLGGPAPYWQTYTYDTIGNLTQRTDRTKTTSSTTTLTYPTTADRPRPHFATTAATTGSTTRTRTFTADPAGNTLTRVDGATTQTMTWDPEGHLSTVKTGATVKATYLYDADGNRIIRREAGRTTLYVGPTELTATQATGVLSVQRYYTFNGRTIAVRNGPGLTNVAVLFTDPHNTATHAAAATTSTLTVRRTTPYGSARGPAVTWPGDHGFLDGPTDTTTELTHLGDALDAGKGFQMRRGDGGDQRRPPSSGEEDDRRAGWEGGDPAPRPHRWAGSAGGSGTRADAHPHPRGAGAVGGGIGGSSTSST